MFRIRNSSNYRISWRPDIISGTSRWQCPCFTAGLSSRKLSKRRCSSTPGSRTSHVRIFCKFKVGIGKYHYVQVSYSRLRWSPSTLTPGHGGLNMGLSGFIIVLILIAILFIFMIHISALNLTLLRLVTDRMRLNAELLRRIQD